jgi:hypothetical protein
MLVDGVTINDGKDSLVGVCATPICIDKRIADMAIKAVEATRPVAIMINRKVLRATAQIGQCLASYMRRDEGADDRCRHKIFGAKRSMGLNSTLLERAP